MRFKETFLSTAIITGGIDVFLRVRLVRNYLFFISMKLYIVSNRLPVKVTNQDETFIYSRSAGGLTTGLDSLQMSYERHWIGWPGICTDSDEEKLEITAALQDAQLHPVFLSEEQVENYYGGYSNSTIWPLCHYFYVYTQCKSVYWESYQEVNRLFCEEISQWIEPGDRVWVQDYQLMLLPGMLREKFPKLSIGYFHHIPFPSYELFRILPERGELLRGLLGADFVAFHTHDYMRHFISTAERVLHLDFKLNEVQLGNRFVRIDALPMGINYELYHHASHEPDVRAAIDRMRTLFGDHKLILSVDRLDYSKGILHRLEGFSLFLGRHPEYHGRVTLAMVIVPSRAEVDSYMELKTKIDEEIGRINGHYSTMTWTPVCYFYHGFPLEELAAMYYVSDIALVTPLRDGMNLVAKEYIATKDDNAGVLILSEMAGASVELSDAIHINPNDTDQIEQAICEALEMPEQEQRERLCRLQDIVSTHTVDKWATDFIDGLESITRKNKALCEKRLTDSLVDSVKSEFDAASRRLIILDYDGTLVPIRKRPEQASPTVELIEVLKRLTADSDNHVVINSGRDYTTLENWLGMLPLAMAAEHGAYYKEGDVWHKRIQPSEWDDELLSILRLFVAKTPRSHLEIKETALAWHYRECDAWLGTLRSQQLVAELVSICLKRKLQILQGNKVVEIKPLAYNKGSDVERLLSHTKYDFMLAMGDDTTDEDIFRVLPENATTIKVGNASTTARYNLPLQSEVLSFLETLIDIKPTQTR